MANPNEELTELQEAWVSEAACPTLLPLKQELVDSLQELLANQQGIIDDVQGDTTLVFFTAMVYQEDIERTQFAVARYLRTRMLKLESGSPPLDGDLESVCSRSELDHREKYQQLLQRHLDSSFLRLLPEEFQQVDETPGANRRKETYVFTKAVSDVQGILVDDKKPLDNESEERIDAMSGDLNVLRFNTVEHLVGQQKLSLV